MTPQVHEAIVRLRGIYGARTSLQENRPVLDAVIATLLRQSTTQIRAARAMAALKTRFVDWAEVRRAAPEEIEREIRSAGLAQLKTARIRALLNHVYEVLGRTSLDFVRRLPVEEARTLLLDLPGVGPKSAAHVVAFVLGVPDLPVGTHVLRVVRRLGWVGATATAAAAYDRLRAEIPDLLKGEVHGLLLAHGRSTCTARRPRCDRCALADTCRNPPEGRAQRLTGNRGA